MAQNKLIGFLKKTLVGAGLTLLLTAGTAYGKINNHDYVCNYDLCTSWNYHTNLSGNLTGEAELIFENIGSKEISWLKWGVCNLLTLTPPANWGWNYNENKNLLKLNRKNDKIEPEESIKVLFSFDPTGKGLGYTELTYFGHGSKGLENVVTVTPEPASSLLFLSGAGLFGIKHLRKKFKKHK